jgi:hypothetical protein
MGIIVLLSIFSLFIGCTPPQKPVFGLNPVLSISEPPALGKPVKVSLYFISPDIKGPEGEESYYSALIELDDVFQLVDGDLETTGKIIPGETHTLEATIKSVKKTGSGQIYGWVTLHFNPGETGGASEFDVLFITITDKGATVRETQSGNGFSCDNYKTTVVTTTPFTTSTPVTSP